MTPKPWVENQTVIENYGRTRDLSQLRTYLEADGSPNAFFGLTSLLHAAVSAGQTAAVKLLLEHGADANGVPDSEIPVPPLLAAVSHDSVETVRMLLDAGADVNLQDIQGDTAILKAREHDNVDMTLILLEHGADPTLKNIGGFSALNSGPRYAKTNRVGAVLHSKGFSVAEESSRTNTPAPHEPPPTGGAQPNTNSFAQIRELQTNGGNYGITTDDILTRLATWNERYGIAVTDVAHDFVRIAFLSLPDPLEPLANEIAEFCPDVISKGFGCFAEMYGHLLDSREDIPREVAELIAGVDFDDENYGLTILVRALRRDRTVMLWWD